MKTSSFVNSRVCQLLAERGVSWLGWDLEPAYYIFRKFLDEQLNVVQNLGNAMLYLHSLLPCSRYNWKQ